MTFALNYCNGTGGEHYWKPSPYGGFYCLYCSQRKSGY